MSEQQVRMIILSTEDLDASIDFYDRVMGFPVKFRDGNHFAALDGGSVTVALATAVDHPAPGQVVIGVRADDVDGVAGRVGPAGGTVLRHPYDDAHERRAVIRDDQGNGLVVYQSLT